VEAAYIKVKSVNPPGSTEEKQRASVDTGGIPAETRNGHQ
jgi:hypothetical protein